MKRRLRALSGRDVVRILETFHFHVVKTRGAHAKLRDVARNVLTIPLLDALGPETLAAILRHAPELKKHFY